MSAKLQAKFDEAYAQHERGHLDRAEAGYKAVLKQIPDHAPSFYLLGLIAHARKEYKQAVRHYKHVLKITPRDADAYFEMANSLQAQDLHEEALACIDKAILLDSQNSDYYCNRGLILRSLERFEEAVASYDQGLALSPEDIDLWFNKGNALRSLKNENEALKCYLQTWQRHPEHFDAWNNSGLALLEIRQYQAALNSFEKAIALRPQEAGPYCGAATALENLGEPGKALEYLSKAARCDGDHIVQLEIAQRSASAQIALRCYVDAESNYRKVLTIVSESDFPKASFNLSSCLFLTEKMQEAWQQYEWRFSLFPDSFIQSVQSPRWDGIACLKGQRLLLLREQGLGDVIQFCRYAKILVEQGATVMIQVPRVLIGLIGSLDDRVKMVLAEEELPPHDYHLPLLSTPHRLGAELNTIPEPEGYLHADPQKKADWSERLSRYQHLRIGLVWSGNIQFGNDHRRSVPFEVIRQLFDLFEADWFAVQKDIREYEMGAVVASTLILLGDQFVDFSDTAAAIDNLDLVISVDTSLAHLAGALGKPVWIMLPYSADWRWFNHERTDSPWYTSARLFRQRTVGNWQSVIDNIAAALAHEFPQLAR